MKSSLSPGQARVGRDIDLKLAKAIINLGKSQAEIAYIECLNYCRLMADDKFDLAKCVDYTRSGTKTCYYCRLRPPLRTVEEALREGVMSLTGICKKCKQPRTIVAKGNCHRCGYGDWKNLSAEDVAELIASGTVMVRQTKSAQIVKEQTKKAEEQKDLPLETGEVKGGGPGEYLGKPHPEPQTEVKGPADRLSVIADSARKHGLVKGDQPEGDDTMYRLKIQAPGDDDLFMQIEEMAFKNRRPVESEILVLLDEAVKGRKRAPGTVNAEELKKTLERCKRYPVPNGSAKEVFGMAFGLAIERVDEMLDIN